jgi:hypothetical protein
MPAVLYTMFGGVQAVTWTDVKIMVLIILGLMAMIVASVMGMPDGVGLTDGLRLAAITGRLRSFDFSTDLTNQYTFWSGTIAALFLFCSYFGTDQSQVQRYLTARSVDEARHSLLVSAYWKIPLQLLVLFVGVLVFVFYVFNPPPLLFSRVQEERLRAGESAPAFAALQSEFAASYGARREAATDLWPQPEQGTPRVREPLGQRSLPDRRTSTGYERRPRRSRARRPVTAHSRTSTTSSRRSS